jgi:hypothetical protein
MYTGMNLAIKSFRELHSHTSYFSSHCEMNFYHSKPYTSKGPDNDFSGGLKLPLCLSNKAWTYMGGAEVKLHVLQASVIDYGEWKASYSGYLTSRERVTSFQWAGD